MPRAAPVFACQSCGATAPKWLGRCPTCGEWNTYVEEPAAEGGAAPAGDAAVPSPMAGEPQEAYARVSTGLPGFDRVLGGGLVSGSVVLLGGEPGIGKSTFLLQAARALAAAGSGEVLYATAEESAAQVRMRGERLGVREDSLLLVAETDVRHVVAAAERRPPALLIVDSVQAVRESALTSGAGTVTQVRECAAVLQRFAKTRGVPVVLIGHVTKDGSLAGPKSLEHLVDTVLTLEGERTSLRRVLRATKNRFGPVDELALYDMTGEGLAEIANPSAALLAERRTGLPGSAVTATREGSRCLLIEIQALVGPVSAGSPRRVAIGFDPGRLALLLAVLEGAGLPLSSREVFISCAGGLSAAEPAADLAAVAALASSAKARPIAPDAVCFGEIGLLGEVRRVPAAGARLKEAAAMGFSTVYLPAGDAAQAARFHDVKVRPVDKVAGFLRDLFA